MTEARSVSNEDVFAPQVGCEQLPKAVLTAEEGYLLKRRHQAEFEFWLDERTHVNYDIEQSVNTIYASIEKRLTAFQKSLRKELDKRQDTQEVASRSEKLLEAVDAVILLLQQEGLDNPNEVEQPDIIPIPLLDKVRCNFDKLVCAIKQIKDPDQSLASFLQCIGVILESLERTLDELPNLHDLSNIVTVEFALADSLVENGGQTIPVAWQDTVAQREQLYDAYASSLTKNISASSEALKVTLEQLNDALTQVKRLRGVRVDAAVTAVSTALEAAYDQLIERRMNQHAEQIDSAVEIVRSALKALQAAPHEVTDKLGAVQTKWPEDFVVVLKRTSTQNARNQSADSHRFKEIDDTLDALKSALQCAKGGADKIDALTVAGTADIPSEYGRYASEVALGALMALNATPIGNGRSGYSAELPVGLQAFKDALTNLNSTLDDDDKAVRAQLDHIMTTLPARQQAVREHQCALMMYRAILPELKKLILLFERKDALVGLTPPGQPSMETLRNNEQHLKFHHAKAQIPEKPVDDDVIGPVGLAFSGGGMRSASYNLGLMQGLAELGILPYVDYLSTVSGGGYLGSCTTSLLSSRTQDWQSPQESNPEPAVLKAIMPVTEKTTAASKDDRADDDYKEYITGAGFPFSVHWPRFPLNPNIKVFDNRAGNIAVSVTKGPNAQLAHLRNKGNVLIPRMGWANRDVLRGVGGTLGGVFYTVMMVLLGLFVVAGATYSIFALLSPTLILDEGVQVIPAAKSSDDSAKEESVTPTPTPDPSDLKADAIAQAAKTDESSYARVTDSETAFLALSPVPEEFDQGAMRRHLLRISTHKWDGTKWRLPWWPYVLAASVGVVFAVLFVFLLRWWQDRLGKDVSPGWQDKFLAKLLGVRDGDGRSREEHEDSHFLGQFSWLYLAVLLVSTLVIRYSPYGVSDGPQIFWIWLPFSFAAGTWSGLFVYRGISAYFGGPDLSLTWSNIRYRTIYWAMQGVSIYALVITLVATVMIIPFFFIVPNAGGPGAITPLATTILTTIAASLLSRFLANKDEDQLEKMWKWLPPAFHGGLLLYLLGFLVLFLNLSLIYLGWIIYDQWLTMGIVLWGVTVPIGATAGLITAILALLALAKSINFNYISPHYFYRDRLGDAFLKTELEIKRDNVPGVVEDARDHQGIRLTQINPDGCSAPYYLVVTALNLPGTWRMKYKDRRAVHFILSRFFCGSSVTGYVQTQKYRRPAVKPVGVTKLSRAMALSGAAVAANVGFRTFFAQAFMLTLLNVRLGLWMTSPRMYQKNEVEYAKIERPLWLRYLWDELSGCISERRDMVYLSDGAHNGDGNGLMPLLERRCKIIIVGDANEDPDYRFESLFRAIYQAKSDLDVDIRIDVTPLQPKADPKEGKTGVCKSHYVIGRIIYPPCKDGASPDDVDMGWLIYFKPTITEHVPSEIRQYWATHKEMFPQVTTADVFFDEEQMEAYRRIGEFSVKHAYQRILLRRFRKNWRYPSHKIYARFQSLYEREQGAAARCTHLQGLFSEMLPQKEMFYEDVAVSTVHEVGSDPTTPTAAQALVENREFVGKFEKVELHEVGMSEINFYRLRVSPFAEDVIDDLLALCKPAAPLSVQKAVTPAAKLTGSSPADIPAQPDTSLGTPAPATLSEPPPPVSQQQSVWDDDDYGF